MQRPGPRDGPRSFAAAVWAVRAMRGFCIRVSVWSLGYAAELSRTCQMHALRVLERVNRGEGDVDVVQREHGIVLARLQIAQSPSQCSHSNVGGADGRGVATCDVGKERAEADSGEAVCTRGVRELT